MSYQHPKSTDELGPDWEIPTGLTRAGRKAAEALRQFAVENKLTYTGGGRVFYTPAEWQEKGESYGSHSLLICCYEGADIRSALSLDGYAYDTVERFARILDGLDLFAEECTSWYCAIYNA